MSRRRPPQTAAAALALAAWVATACSGPSVERAPNTVVQVGTDVAAMRQNDVGLQGSRQVLLRTGYLTADYQTAGRWQFGIAAASQHASQYGLHAPWQLAAAGTAMGGAATALGAAGVSAGLQFSESVVLAGMTWFDTHDWIPWLALRAGNLDRWHLELRLGDSNPLVAPIGAMVGGQVRFGQLEIAVAGGMPSRPTKVAAYQSAKPEGPWLPRTYFAWDSKTAAGWAKVLYWFTPSAGLSVQGSAGVDLNLGVALVLRGR